MSYRECRNLCEMLRSLNYPRLISLQNFIKPNFELVADILYWLAQKYDPQTQISDDINQEKDRVEFIKTVVTLFSTKARIKLNPKKLYQSDSQAVQQILKIVVLLYKASNSKGIEEEEAAVVTLPAKVSNLKAHKILANEICQLGTRLYDSLGKQPELKKTRAQALKFLDGINGGGNGEKDQAYIQKCVKQIMQQQNQNMQQMSKYVTNMEKEQTNLQEKLKKKSAELQRAQKRYKSLIGVKPAFMEEFQRFEQELEGMYQIYVEKYRNINYLQSELEKYSKAEEQALAKNKRQLQKMREIMKKRQENDLRHEQELDDGLLQPENQRGFTRGNSRRNEKGGGGKDGAQLGEREEEEESQGNEQGNSEEQQSGDDLQDEDDDSNF